MKRAKRSTLKCDKIAAAIAEVEGLIEHFDVSDPEDVRTRTHTFASALKDSGLVEEEQGDKNKTFLFYEVIDALRLPDLQRYLAEIELFDLYVSEYTDLDEESMKEAQAMLEHFGPEIIAALRKMEEECRQTSKNS